MDALIQNGQTVETAAAEVAENYPTLKESAVVAVYYRSRKQPPGDGLHEDFERIGRMHMKATFEATIRKADRVLASFRELCK